MKRLFSLGMFVAAAAMTFAGCSKEDVSENGAPVAGGKVVRSFVAEFATSRTTLNDAMTRMVWSEGDQLGIYTDVETDLNVASSTPPSMPTPKTGFSEKKGAVTAHKSAFRG